MMLKLKNLLLPTGEKIRLFLSVFLGLHVLNAGLVYLIGGFWDGGLSIGLPLPFYVINCGLIRNSQSCNYGLHIGGLLFDVAFWYCIAIVIKRRK